jgi:hypothetical protein
MRSEDVLIVMLQPKFQLCRHGNLVRPIGQTNVIPFEAFNNASGKSIRLRYETPVLGNPTLPVKFPSREVTLAPLVPTVQEMPVLLTHCTAKHSLYELYRI